MRRISLLLLLLLTACATPQNNYDPLEKINRPIFDFNMAVDQKILRPVAVAYVDYVPSPLRSGVHNFSSNIGDLFAIPAAAFQGKGHATAMSSWRVLVNTTLGLGGLIDVASDVPIPKQDNDFGQMLGAWGISSGPYLMVPFYGSLTLRDSIDPLARLSWGPIDYIPTLGGQVAYYGVYLTDLRASVLPMDKLLEDQPDPYAFLRDGYLQRRWFKVYDGNPPHQLKLGEDDDNAPLSDEKPAASTASAPQEQP